MPLSLSTQRGIIDDGAVVTLDALGEDLGEANEPTVAEKVIASPVSEADRKISYAKKFNLDSCCCVQQTNGKHPGMFLP